MPMSRPSHARNEAIIVGVVGVTGSGKSSFIKRVTSRADIVARTGDNSVTQDIAQYPFEYGGRRFILIDTPGFDDGERDDEDIFRELAKWTEKSFRAGQRLNGLIYLHPISLNRERGSEARNLKMFKKLCGENNFGNIMLGLTFCDMETDDTIARRLSELTDNNQWWGDMTAAGSTCELVQLDPEACRRLLLTFIYKEKVTLKIQSELVEQGLSLDQTEAAQTIVDKQELDRLRAREQIELADLQAEYYNRMKLATASYDKKMADIRRRYNADRKRQEYEQKLVEMQIQFNDELERKERLFQEQERERDEAAAVELKRMEEQLKEVRLTNDHLEKIKDLKALCISRYYAFEKDEWAAVQAWRKAGHIKQRFVYMDGEWENWPHRYTGHFCAGCLDNFGLNASFHTCVDCVTDLSFLDDPKGPDESNVKRIFDYFCDTCVNTGQGCFQRNHSNFRNHTTAKIPGLVDCQRIKDYNGSWKGTTCNGCAKEVGGVFFHCCTCDEQYDLCIECWGKGATCKDANHKLHAIGQCPPELRKQISG